MTHLGNCDRCFLKMAVLKPPGSQPSGLVVSCIKGVRGSQRLVQRIPALSPGLASNSFSK